MSDYIERNTVFTHFEVGESWAILSPIEQSIKKKIEAVGKPLKDWDVKIYRGILTGYNKACNYSVSLPFARKSHFWV